MKYKLKAIKTFKYLFYKFGIHRVIPGSKMNFIGHLHGISKWISEHKDHLKFTTFPTRDIEYNKRELLHQYIIDNEITNNGIDYLEFGVAEGKSFKWWVAHEKSPDSRFFGFDTFTGLPEDWGPFKKGSFSNGNEPPKIDDGRCSFYQGLFQKTLDNFLKSYKSEKQKVIHMDADIYTATLYVLTTITPFLKKGDILLFDEFNVPMHEYKAFTEWVSSFYINYSVIGEINNFYQVAIRIE